MGGDGFDCPFALVGVFEVGGDRRGAGAEAEADSVSTEAGPGHLEGFGGGVDRAVLDERGGDGVVVEGGGSCGGAGGHTKAAEPVMQAREGHFGGGGEALEAFACLVAGDELVVGQSHRLIVAARYGRGVDIDDLDDLESSVLDGLDAADDAEAPPGTLSLSAARRRRGLVETVRLLDGA